LSRLGTWQLTADLPYRQTFPGSGPVIARSLSQERTASVDQAGEFLQWGTASTSLDGSLVTSFSFFADARTPQQCGCGCGQNGCACGGPAPKPPGRPWWAGVMLGLGCFVGGVITAPSIGGTIIVEAYCLTLLEITDH
jgi:hypothetical protein